MADSVEIPADKKDRLDRLVVDMGLAHTRSRAKALQPSISPATAAGAKSEITDRVVPE